MLHDGKDDFTEFGIMLETILQVLQISLELGDGLKQNIRFIQPINVLVSLGRRRSWLETGVGVQFRKRIFVVIAALESLHNLDMVVETGQLECGRGGRLTIVAIRGTGVFSHEL